MERVLKRSLLFAVRLARALCRRMTGHVRVAFGSMPPPNAAGSCTTLTEQPLRHPPACSGRRTQHQSRRCRRHAIAGRGRHACPCWGCRCPAGCSSGSPQRRQKQVGATMCRQGRGGICSEHGVCPGVSEMSAGYLQDSCKAARTSTVNREWVQAFMQGHACGLQSMQSGFRHASKAAFVEADSAWLE
eukprot:365455-Chlamydomonas_euryale.AAC.19